MVPKPCDTVAVFSWCFRAVLFRMVPKLKIELEDDNRGFRAVLFRMVPKLQYGHNDPSICFRAVLFRMVPKHIKSYSFFK